MDFVSIEEMHTKLQRNHRHYLRKHNEGQKIIKV